MHDENYDYVGGSEALVRLLETFDDILAEDDIDQAADLINKLSVRGDIILNEQQQMDLEAAIIYLTGKYNSEKRDADKFKKTLYTTLLVGIVEQQQEDNIKGTDKSRDAQVRVDENYADARDRLDRFIDVCEILDKLYWTVINRGVKLTNLGNNYRRELKTDE